MPGSRWNFLSIFILCICQYITGVSAQAPSGSGDSPGVSQEHVIRQAEDQRNDEENSIDFISVPSIFQDLITPAGNSHLYKIDIKAQLSGQKERKVRRDLAEVVSKKDGVTDKHEKDVSEVSHRSQPMPTLTSHTNVTSSVELVPHQPPFKTSLGKKLFGVPNTRQNTRQVNTKNISTSFNSSSRPDMSTEVFGLNIKTLQTNISDGQPTPGPRDILDKDVQSVNETDLALGSLQRDNSTWSWPASESSSQLQHTTIVVTHQKDKTNRKKALFVKETRNPNTNITASDRNTPSRQFEERVGTHVQSPVLPYSVSEDAAKIVKKQPQPSVQLGARGEPIKNDQLVVTSAVPVVTTEPVTSEELVTSVEPATSTQSRASAHQEIGAEFTEDNGKLSYADNEEEESNETSTCTTCSKSALMEEQVKAIRIDMFKELLAQKLRIDLNDTTMQGAVNDGTPVVNPPKLPQAILEQTIKDNVNELEKDQFYARDEEIIIAGEDLGRDCPWSGATGCYRFNLKGKVKLAVAEAQLWFYKLKDTNDVKGQLFKVIQLNRMYQRLIGVDRNFVQEGWVKINITGELHKWLDTGKNSHVLAIRCATCTAKSYTSLFGVKQGYKPLLVVKYSANNRLTRSKRSQSCDPVSECCKRDLVVNFHEIRMAEIYEPRNLSIGYCYGSCNDGHQFTYNHTTLKQRLRLSSSYSSQPTMSEQLKSCCVPLVLKDTFIMATEGTDYVRKIVPKVIVETCGCM